jgi:hypothetical protein
LPQEVNQELVDAVEGVTKEWAKIIKAEERSAAARARREEKLQRRRTVSIIVMRHGRSWKRLT